MNSRASLEEDQDGDPTTNEAPSFRGRSPARALHVHCSSTANDHRTAGAGFCANRSRKTRLATSPVGLFRTGNHEQQRYLRADGGRGGRRSWFFSQPQPRHSLATALPKIGLSNAVISGHSSQSTKTRRAAINRCNRRLKSLAFLHPIRNSHQPQTPAPAADTHPHPHPSRRHQTQAADTDPSRRHPTQAADTHPSRRQAADTDTHTQATPKPQTPTQAADTHPSHPHPSRRHPPLSRRHPPKPQTPTLKPQTPTLVLIGDHAADQPVDLEGPSADHAAFDPFVQHCLDWNLDRRTFWAFVIECSSLEDTQSRHPPNAVVDP